MRNNIKYLFLIIVLIGLIIPQQTLAFVDVFSFFRTALQGVKTITAPLITEVVKIFFIYIIGIVAVATSGSLLKLVVLHPEWLTLQTNEMVRSGFHFTSGLANMLLILIFIIIAFAMILKMETFPIKKTLPKLIIVALLLNFSLVFIGMLIDISNILYSEILEKGFLVEGKDLIGDVLGKIIGGGWGVVATIMAWLGVLGISAAIPFVAPWVQLALIGALATIFLPNILVWVFQIVLFFLLAGILFTYVFLFVARVFIIWILAVLAPLAFLCLILPQTEKYWKEWLQHLIQWIFLGIAAFFFLVLGLRMTDALIPPGAESFIAAGSPWPIIGWFKLEKYLLYYLFLFIYLVIVLWISKRTMPALADFIIQQATTWGGRMWTGVLKPLGGAMGRQAGRAAALQKEKEEEAKREGRPLTFGEKLGRGMAAPVRFGYRMRGITPEQEAAKEIEAEAAELEKKFGKDTESAMTGGLPYGWKVADPRTKAAMALYLARRGQKYFTKELDPEKQIEAATLALQSPEALDTILSKGNPHLVNRESDLFVPAIYNRYAAKVNTKPGEEDSDYKESYEKFREEGLEHEEAKEKATEKTVFDRVATDVKPGDIKDLNKEMFKGPAGERTRQAYIERFGPEYFNQIAMNFDQEVMDWFTEAANKMGGERIAKKNPRLLRYFATFGKERWGWKPVAGAESVAAVEGLIRRARGPEAIRGEVTSRESERERLMAIPEADRTRGQRERMATLDRETAQLRKELEEAERRERERPPVAPPKPEEEPYLIRIEKAKTKKEKERLQREFDSLPEDIKTKEREILAADQSIREARGNRKLVEEEIERAKKEGAPAEELTRLQAQAEAQQREIERRTRTKEDLMPEWRGLITAEELRHPERGYVREIAKFKEEERKAKKRLRRFKKLKRAPEDIERAERDLQRIRQRGGLWEGKLAVHFRSKELGSKIEDTRERVEDQKTQVTRMEEEAGRLRSEVEGVSREIESIDRGISAQQTRLESVRSERAELVARVQEEISSSLREAPEEERKRFLDKEGKVRGSVLRERERIDPRFRPLDEEIKAIPGTVRTMREQRKARSTDLRGLETRRREAERRYGALDRGVTAMEREIGEMESEIGKIESGERLMGRRIEEMSEEEKREFESYLRYRGNLPRRKSVREKIKKLVEEQK